GESEGSCERTRLDHQVEDLVASIDFMVNNEKIDSNKIGASGHSLGATTVIKTAAEDDRIKAVVTLSPVARLEWEHLFPKEKILEWKRTGRFVFPGPKGPMNLKFEFYHDLAEFDGTQEVKNIKVPICFVQGEADKITPLINSQRMYDNANEPKKLQIVKGANHMFSKPEHEKEALETTTSWFSKHL
ncbi:MAG: prolyl oligopeptidase family serine peptidase, partial [Candidatus Diapherotrites archaeon]|nr:prolyl oligopeptidase family serine peptidase [Candidatus Diapherotrites archaeon]